ncbi:hypothetical protein [Streptomyces sp. DSM 40484]|uniref:hypothetical protein n=1 Tax=Streptomyces kroppenstedtii TaxID=3051181 RepID=UPI0028D1876B|nr:hypothetical protein [Streptomyces sp. DSM 40484]
MTHNGQGDEPSARPAREGIVLPSDGGEPLLPGQTGDRAVPAGGQAWDQPWGPRSASQGDEWGGAGGAGSPGGAGGPGGARGGAGAGGAGQAPDTQISSWSAGPQGAGGQVSQYNEPPAGSYGAQDQGGPWGAAGPQAHGGAIPQQQHQPPQQQQQQQQQYDGRTGDGYGVSQAHGGYGYPGAGAGAGALPPAASMDEGATQFLPPVASAPAMDEGATQFLPPVGPGALPPEMPAAGAASGDATQYLGQVPSDGPGPLPAAVDPGAQPTQFMAPVPSQPGSAGTGTGFGVRPGGPGSGPGPEDRQQPPAEFDNLFRADGGGATQQLPPVDQPRARRGRQPGAASPEFGAPAGFGTPGGFGASGGAGGVGGAGASGGPEGPGGRGARRAADGDHGRGGRSRSRVPLIAAVGVGIAVLGIGAGALLSGGGGEEDKGDENTTVAATASASEDSGSSEVGPEEKQAVALDKLLADSGNSRDSVVKAVDNVRKCTNLGQAAADLRDAAEQRNGLVTRLSGLSVDKLENHAKLTAALKSAWKASAAADTHYAAWADQVAGKKGCNKGQARSTGQTAAGNRESGTATTQKAAAAELWNSIAQAHGLTERQPGQL